MPTDTKGHVPAGYADEIVISESSFRALHRGVQSRPDIPSKKRKREDKGDPSILHGPKAYKGPWAKWEEEKPDSSSEEEVEVEYEEDELEDIAREPPPELATGYEDIGYGKETTEFHGSEEHDYQGRTYMYKPRDLGIKLEGDNSDLKCYVPKKLIHTWKSHQKPVTQMRFFPDSGHLLLSASADNKIKLFDVYHQRELLRSYSGHTKSVNDIDFNNDGTEFLSASFDRQMKLWDTETGACKSRFTTGKTPHVIRFNPDPANEHLFIAGMADKKIVQFDTRSGEMVQEYDHHLGPVNTLTFCDENKRFISTSDDKSLRAWEWDIPVPIKFIAEPHMYPMVRSAPHPRKNFVAFQSSDNQIVVYASTERFRQNRKKVFRGHNCAGYGVDVAFSPDGEIVASGDTGGYVVFWDWKTCKMWHKIQASDVPVVSVAWHPRETSKVVTGDLNGVIKYWD
ncbi:WD40 repeat-like protein [Aulographum hederae CBS 113979]|uniref:WD40 repeat-like protein n=1 Tax=Aulographum hederae CBS 113979 TaxID=1176131 RepID=A0A6G1HAP0_9PEZI|nr:WD40 repeat-like protein [Aulographum hederae CBS 113979]